MAQIYPDDFQIVEKDSKFHGELETLLRLRDELPDKYSVFHGVHWTKIEDDAAIYGEIDFIIVNPYGKILAIEQKETQVEIDKKGRLIAIYHERNGQITEKDIEFQVTRNIQSLRQEFTKRHPQKTLDIDHLIYLPTAIIGGKLPANVAIGRVVDSRESKNLTDIIRVIFDKNSMPSGHHVPDALAVHEFLSSKAHVSPHVGLLGDQTKQRTTRLSSGLAQWSQRLEFKPFRLIVQGTAGSGKTQLALNELRDAHKHTKTAMYICFNRPLVDSVKLSAPEPNNCMTFHELAKLLAKQNGLIIDFKEVGIFKKLEDYFIANISQLENQLDVLVVDEGQDFEESWANALLKMVKPEGRIIWLEDESQRLYDRDRLDWGEEWVKISSPMNYRSPQRIVNMINGLELTESYLESGNGFRGMIPITYSYSEGYEKEGTIQALEDLIKEGYSPQSIAILTFRGVKSSKLMGEDIGELSDIRLKKFHSFSDSGEAIWTDGELLIDSIFRFKGQCADAVILTEIDFEEFSQNVKNRLFVGLTRARLMVSLVVSERVEEFFDEML
jgi:hypothetical protein